MVGEVNSGRLMSVCGGGESDYIYMLILFDRF